MCDRLHYFETSHGCTAISLPFDLAELISDWISLRPLMARQVPEDFTRDEWAYLSRFLDPENLRRPYRRAFGEQVRQPTQPVTVLARPRGLVATWLPNNVSLLGPLTLILLSLSGAPLTLKGGSRSNDLTGAFLRYVKRCVRDGALREYLATSVKHEVLAREDPRQHALAADAAVRIVFGSNEAAEAIHRLVHPVESIGFSFVDRRSEAWLEDGALTDDVLRSLIKVFAIYGQAGCTSPARVVLLNQPIQRARALRDRLLALWPSVVRHDPPAHVASSNVMTRQCAAALGWDAKLAARNGAVLAVGNPDSAFFGSPMALPIVASPLEWAMKSLPENVQTIGHALCEPYSEKWLATVSRTRAKRFVPLANMHHFGPIWDGHGFWRATFEEIEVGS